MSITLTCDSSSYGIGAVLSQLHNGIEKTVALNLQCLKVLRKIIFHKYVMGNEFTVVTDHELLVFLFSEKQNIPQVANARLIRYSIILSSYQNKIQYRKGKHIQNAICLSHLPNNSVVALPDDYDCNLI
ncbi:hypothetical protein PR048_027013 [Dryococelus australis]|uniref:Reverse transcriptase RNase H-like domain-containing protein n=1 Tax=Dryococelus australis TaxID=614101 RepID=A0ABQ9GMZ1_9NEOP|nr:hypothetical protein PR048_027013 [Dryococelus australis]